jgi:hypothetical protein
MTTTRAGRLSMGVAVVVLMVASMTWSTIEPARATHPADRVPRAQHRILGQHLTNHHTHMETWIVGWYRYHRRVRIHHHWRSKTFYGLRVSSQHCTPRRCWGRVVRGQLWSPHQPGRPVPRRSDEARPSAGRGDLCLQGTTSCAAPWNWYAGFIDRRQKKLVELFVDPCAGGSLAGGGVVLTKNLSARILFEGGVLTAARAASVFEGPPGIAVGALAGCMTGVASQGFHTVKGLLDHLNPLGRGAVRGG